MEESERMPRRSIPLQTCLACGSTWFREATFYQWPSASSTDAMPITLMRQTMLVCLCGTPVQPSWSWVRGGRAADVELVQFHQSLERVKDVLASRHREAVQQKVEEVGARRQPVKTLDTALTRVERELGPWQSRITSKKTTPGRTWQPPRRQASKQIGRDHLALQLQIVGLTFRQARQVVDAIWESIKEALQRGEDVETPLGRFHVVERPEPTTRWRLGKMRKPASPPSKPFHRHDPTGFPRSVAPRSFFLLYQARRL
jgi:Bacterial DNA-binding protein